MIYQLETMRMNGWQVAIHNDYMLAGKFGTFWLFTHPSGRWVKGEGATDEEALRECNAEMRKLQSKGHP